ncbi:MAG: glycosyltransferase family 4 protein, partial [bacterium]
YRCKIDGIEIFGKKTDIYSRFINDVFLNLKAIKKTKKRFLREKNFFRILFNYSNIMHFIKVVNPDIIHCHHIQRNFSYAYECFCTTDIPYIATTHSYHSITFREGAEKKRNAYMVKKNMEDCKNLIYVSSHLKSESRDLFKKYPENEYIIQNPIDMNKFNVLNKVNAKIKTSLEYDKVILYVGSFIKRKGYDILLKAISKLHNQQIHVVFIGSGEKDELISIAKNLNILDQLTIIDHVKQDDLIDYYNASELVVIPSSSESFGLIFIEALACGTPVIGTKGVPEEIIPEEDYGYRVEIGNIEELTEKIKLSINKVWDRNKLMEFAESFSWETSIQKYIDIYETVIKGNSLLH